MKVFGVVGWSGSGKTDLLVRLLPELVSRGYRVSTIKHAHHKFDIDKPGKDSHRHREAGATEVLISSATRWALLHENRGEPELGLDDMIGRMTPVDLLLVEGFKTEAHGKLEVYRAVNETPLIARDDPDVVAVAADGPVEGLSVPVLDLENEAAVADFIIEHCGLAAPGAAGKSETG